MRKLILACASLTICQAFPQFAFAQSCTPYTVGGFTLGQTTSLDRPGRLRCGKYEDGCLLRKHEFSKNGFDYEVLLTADTFEVVEVIGQNKEFTGNDDDFEYFANLMTQKYKTADSSGEYYGYKRNRKDTAFRTGALSKWQKHKAAEAWENHACWGTCPTTIVDIDGPKSTQIPGKPKGYVTWSYLYSKGAILDVEKTNGLYLNMRRSTKLQELTIRANCPKLMRQVNRKATNDNRTGEF